MAGKLVVFGLILGIILFVFNYFFNSDIFPARLFQAGFVQLTETKEDYFPEDITAGPSLESSREDLTEQAEPEESDELPEETASRQNKALTMQEIQERIDDISKEDGIEEELEWSEELKKEEICRVDINSASGTELQKITGIGSVLSQRIIEARPFHSISDLTRVKGIGQITLQEIIEQNCAYTGGFYAGGGAPPPAAETASFYPKILISEIQISPIHDRFVELYNPNNGAVNLSDWYIQRKTETGSSWASFISSTYFEGKTIGAKSHFLVASSSYADIVLNLTLTDSNSLILKNPEGEITDKIGWGKSQEFETAAADSPSDSQSLGRKWSTTTESYIDIDNNQNDFKIQTPTPDQQNQGQVSENQMPQANFVFLPANPEVFQGVLFDASSSVDSDGAITAFVWNFGDGIFTTTSQATTTHLFSTSSEFLITLLVLDNMGTASLPATATISVNSVLPPSEPSSAETVVINEIAWTGTATSSWDEWIELYNNTASTIDLTGWKILKDGEDFIEITATTTILAFNFYLLERDEKATNVPADFVYGGGKRMSNTSCEVLLLYNQLDQLIDQTACLENGNWPAGKANPDYVSMERIDSTAQGSDSVNWANNDLITQNGLDAGGNNINGTPKAPNSVSL